MTKTLQLWLAWFLILISALKVRSQNEVQFYWELLVVMTLFLIIYSIINKFWRNLVAGILVAVTLFYQYLVFQSAMKKNFDNLEDLEEKQIDQVEKDLKRLENYE